jgi:hypothetical protein
MCINRGEPAKAVAERRAQRERIVFMSRRERWVKVEGTESGRTRMGFFGSLCAL